MARSFPFKLICPACRAELDAADVRPGIVFPCPRCDKNLEVSHSFKSDISMFGILVGVVTGYLVYSVSTSVFLGGLFGLILSFAATDIAFRIRRFQGKVRLVVSVDEWTQPESDLKLELGNGEVQGECQEGENQEGQILD